MGMGMGMGTAMRGLDPLVIIIWIHIYPLQTSALESSLQPINSVQGTTFLVFAL